MLPPPGRQDQVVELAVARAQEVAPALDLVLMTHYPDADTLDTFRPEETDFDTVAAVNMAVAAELAASGVRVFVQRADRASFRRWMTGRADTQDTRWAWRDRSLLRGTAALKALGVDPTLASPPEKLGNAPGPLADRLVAAFTEDEDEEGSEFEELAHELLATGRNDVLDLAVRKARDRIGEEAADDLTWELLLMAEGAEIGPSGWAGLVALPVALPPHDVPDATELRESLLAADVLPPTADTRFLPGGARRMRSPGSTQSLSAASWSTWLQVSSRVTCPQPPRTIWQRRASASCSGWRSTGRSRFGMTLPPMARRRNHRKARRRRRTPPGLPPSTAGGQRPSTQWAACRWHWCPYWRSRTRSPTTWPKLGQQFGGIEEIRAFVAGARREAADEKVVYRPEVLGVGLELSLYTPSGRFVGSMNMPADRLPARAEDMLRLVELIVPGVKNTPGR